jgi:cytochrome c oxidase cbb3-type subunit 1
MRQPRVSGSPPADAAPFDAVLRHSLLWLFFGNAVGLLLATLLLVPSLGVLLGPLTYGRWVTVHLNASLYGWSSIPLIGLLFLLYLPRMSANRIASAAVTAWSAMLVFSMTGWLSGQTSGKLFMEWSGPSRWALLLGMAFLALALWISYARRLASGEERGASSRFRRPVIGMKLVVLLALTFLPVVMYLAADPSLYPPVNPDSGGATGGSLLGSTLALVMIYWATPFLLALDTPRPWRSFLPVLLLLVAHFGWFALLDHGDRSHRDPQQIIALSSLVIWVPLLVRHLRAFAWPVVSRGWLIAFGCWGAALTLNGIVTFMPHILEQWKFTNALVAHVHIAMAGMITSFNMLVLSILRPDAFPASRTAFIAWHAGTVVHAAALLAVGVIESMHPAWLFTAHPVTSLLYAARWVAGAVMLLASFFWLRHAHTQGTRP